MLCSHEQVLPRADSLPSFIGPVPWEDGFVRRVVSGGTDLRRAVNNVLHLRMGSLVGKCLVTQKTARSRG